MGRYYSESRRTKLPGNISGWPPPTVPPDETDTERQCRIKEEIKAQEVSNAIDRAIDLDKQQERKPNTKILLLGQAESGKSTILKNIQLQFAPKSFYAEAETWKAVIYLNLVRSVNFVLDLLEDTISHPSSGPGGARARSPTTTDDLRFLKIRLAPLRQVEHKLSRRFCSVDGLTDYDASHDSKPRYNLDRASEICVRSGWRALLLKPRRSSPQNKNTPDDLGDSQRVIEACMNDMVSLWEDSVVQGVLREKKVQLQNQSGFFLSDVLRIASKNYMPTSGDILRARLQTIGVEEHRIVIETGVERGNEWLIYDVGGSRGQRAVWAPFVDDVNLIIFLAPISVFDQALSEDKAVNRLWDSFELWKQVCGNKLLHSTHFVILLNKRDILDAKLKAGTMFSKFVTSYKQPNDLEHVSEYLKTKFVSLHHQLTPIGPNPRKLYTHLTCATDPRGTSIVLIHIQEAIILNAFASTDLI